jgi:SAM-dependent methyltransferase
MEEPQKVGTFEWIASFSILKPFIEKLLMSNYDTASQVLVIGCGTSLLAENIASEWGTAHHVAAVDNDSQCIDHLKLSFPASRVHYSECDLLAPINKDILKTEKFTAIIDKGTYDAILVEGSVVDLLRNIFHLLHPQGSYLLFSIHPEDFLCRFFSSIYSGLEISEYGTLRNSDNDQFTVMILRKSSVHPFDEIKFFEHEKTILDIFYKEEQPYLTSELEMKIRSTFAELGDKNNFLLLSQAYEILFEENLEYSLDLFLEDLQQFPLTEPGKMSCEEALNFLRTMQ